MITKFKFNKTIQQCNLVSRALSDIPSPRRLPVIGSTLSLLLSGSTPKLHLYADRLHQKLGPIFRDKIGPVNAIFISDPDLIRSVFRQEGKYPLHIQPEAWMVYNKKHGCSRGLFFMDGDQWLHYRRIMNKLLLKNDTSIIEESCRVVANNLIEDWKRLVRNQERLHLESSLYRWSVKTLVSLLIGPENFQNAQERYETLLNEYATTVNLIFETTSKLTLIPAELAAKLNVKPWKNFEKSVDASLILANKLVRCLMKDFPNAGLLKSMQNEGIDEEFLIRIVSDLILAAGDTTAYTMEWILYLLSKNKNEQILLRKRIIESSDNATHLKNVIRETLRLYPVAPFLTRIFPQETSMDGYNIPSGSLILISLYTSGRNGKIFSEPNKFVPDRWLRERGNLSSMQLASLPFAMGSRSCIGRKIADVQLQITISEIIKNFDVDLENNEDVDIILKMITVPSKPINLKLTIL